MITLLRCEGKLPDNTRVAFEQFRGLTEQERQIERLYEPHSITVLAVEGTVVRGTIRVIIKRRDADKLPCEFAHIIHISNDCAPIIPCPDGTFEIPSTPDLMPIVEVGGFKIDSELASADYCAALKVLMVAAFNEATDIGWKGAFLSCAICPPIEQLYKKRFEFEEAAVISYTMRENYKLFFRWNTFIIPESHTLKNKDTITYG